jgi:hypothetical protein
MNQLSLTTDQVVAIRRAVAAPADGGGAGWGDEQVHEFSVRVEFAVERALRASHPLASEAEISFATAAHWADILDGVCRLWTPRACIVSARRQ